MKLIGFVKLFIFWGLFIIFIINNLPMKKFNLKTKLGEKIFSIEANDFDEALENFSIIKNLPISELSKIFIVEEDKKPNKIIF
jgi:hypothetical protein